jgi:glycosyltransferase involved in cell wall biosynthesis
MVSIIIPTLNEEKVIGRCLEALTSAKHENLELEIIVVDNGSSDKTVAIAQSYGVIALVKKYVRIAALRNYGVAHSQGDVLGFVDADCLVGKNWLMNAIRCMVAQSADAVGSYYAIPEDASWIGKTMELMQSKKTGADVNYIPAGNLLVARGVYAAMGGFDESLETNEDVDFCQRLKDKKYRLYSDPSIHSVHLGTPHTIKELFIKQVWHGSNTITVFLRDIRKLRNFRIVLYSVANAVLLAGCIAGVYLLIVERRPAWLIATFALYLSLNSAVAMLDWKKVRKNFLYIFLYITIYGFARAVSSYKWLFGGLVQKLTRAKG